MNKHSPGPWKWIEDYGGGTSETYRSLVAADGRPVLWDGEYDQGSCNPADDPLLEAAPEMLGLLRSIEWGSDYNFPQCPACGRHRSAGYRMAPDDESDNPCRLDALMKRISP